MGRWWMVVAAAVGVYLAVMGCVMWPADVPANKPPADVAPVEQSARPNLPLTGLPFRGMAMQVQRIDNVMDYGRCVDQIAQAGADTIFFVVDSKQENGTSTHIFLDMRDEPSPQKLGELIDYAHRDKLRVLLMPIVLLEKPRGTEWRGTIQPEVWEDWWDSYRDMLHHYDAVAEAHHVELFVVGSELVSTERQTEQWTRTIRQVRRDYHGLVTYSANWDHYTTVPFWDQLDVMGLNSYYTLGEKPSVTVAQIDAKWAPIQEAILSFGTKIHKPVIMLEVGWCSMANAAKEPWDYTKLEVPLDLDLQTRLYESYFQTWYGKKGFGGFLIWAWTPNASGSQDRGYTPEGKPAEQVLRKWLAKGPWKVE